MKFYKVDDVITGQELLFHRHCCEHNKEGYVELLIAPVMFGFRIKAGYWNDDTYFFDYCAGAEQEKVAGLFSLIKAILEKMSPSEAARFDWPIAMVKPMFNDIVCLTKLAKLAGDYEIDKTVPSVVEMRKITNENYPELNDFYNLLK